ncbi:MAG: response regulator [Verrucomicrobia bacterium]|nr:response regulator [Verrucomicrobiota bacterium]MCF7709292.1 response regulator [Verrucomicrobiota bacterium]
MEKILVIDDEEALREMVVSALTHRGYEVFAAENGEEGFKLAREHLPDLILSDIMMSRMDGYTTLAALRKDPTTAAIPLIMMTGYPNQAGMRHCMDLGADDYLAKPFTVHELFASLDARLKKQRAVKEQAEKKLSELRANISLALPHELRTPLTGILGYAEILMTEGLSVSPEELREFGKAIYSSAERLHRLIENFLIHAQIELLLTDTEKVELMQMSRSEQTSETVRSCALEKARAYEREDDLAMQFEEGPAAIHDEYLKKITFELIDNAFKFSESGTPVKVHTSFDEDTFILMVQDEGRGMTMEQIQSVGAYMQFERKIHEQQGSGLGLSLAKRLTELHNGELQIQSKPNEGTTMLVKIPVCPAAAG